jgi:hypothetical protein
MPTIVNDAPPPVAGARKNVKKLPRKASRTTGGLQNAHRTDRLIGAAGVFVPRLMKIRPWQIHKTNDYARHAILAKVIKVKEQSPNSVAVRLESDELKQEAVIVSTGLDRERTHIKRPDGSLEVTCKGNPRANVGDAVSVVLESQPMD